MQVLPALLLALVAAPGLLPAPEPASPSEGGAAEGTGPVGLEGPGILVTFDNSGPPAELRLLIREGDDTRAQRKVLVPSGHSAWPFPLPEGLYTLRAEGPDSRILYSQDTRGCPGAFLAPYRLVRARPDLDVTRNGCLVRPPAFLDLLEEARAARDARPGKGSVHVPLPAGGDRGELREWSALRPPDWENASRVRFTVRDALMADAWGRETRGPEVSETYLDREVMAWASAFVFESPPVVIENATDVIRFEGGNATPFAHSRTYATAQPGELTARAVARRDLLFTPPGGGIACRYRLPLQGGEIVAGARVPALSACPARTGDEGEWVAGSVRDREGLRALPLYWLREDGESVSVARLWLADGVAYPVEWESWRQKAGDPVWRDAERLVALAPGDTPLALDAPTAPPPAPARLDPLDPLRGPALGEGRVRFAFPLDEAVQAAAAQPGLDALQDLLRRKDAALAGALLRVRSEAGAPALVHGWDLVFTSPGQDPVRVLCERPGLDALRGAPVPVARCAEADGPSFFPDDLGEVTPVGRADLPALASSFDLALARWDATSPARAGSRVTYALYRAWGTDDAPAGVVAVGEDTPENVAPVGTGARGEADQAVLHLSEGRTLAHVTGVVRSAGADTLPAQVVVSPGLSGSEGRLVGESPAPLPPVVVVGAAVGIAGLGLVALLAVLWTPLKSAFAALYTRLTRSQVLDSQTRTRILQLVGGDPGLHAAGVFQALGKREGVTEYHLRVLVREGLLTSVETKGFRRYFVTGRYAPREMRALAALKEGHAQIVYRIVADNPDIPLGEVAVRAQLSLPNASRTVSRLAEAGLLERRKDGRLVRLRVDESWRGAGA